MSLSTLSKSWNQDSGIDGSSTLAVAASSAASSDVPESVTVRGLDEAQQADGRKRMLKLIPFKATKGKRGKPQNFDVAKYCPKFYTPCPRGCENYVLAQRKLKHIYQECSLLTADNDAPTLQDKPWEKRIVSAFIYKKN